MPECGQGAGRFFGKMNKNPEIQFALRGIL